MNLNLKGAREKKDVCEDLFLFPESVTSISENRDNLSNSDVLKVHRKVMPFIQDIEEAREKVAILNTELISEQIDAENVRDNEECNLIDDELHPDFETGHHDFFFEGNVPTKNNRVSSFRKIDLWDNKTIRSRICKLDADQRFVLDLFLKHARDFKLAEKGFRPFPAQKLYVIE